MRTLHRIGGIVAALLFLYIAGTGTLIQTLDLKTLASHAPQSDATMLSIDEGMYGNGSYPVMTISDYDGAELPQGLDLKQAMATVVTAMRRAYPMAAPGYVELRMVGGAATGEATLDKQVVAFNAETGVSVTPAVLKPLALPPSLREKTKRLHRFWDRKDVPGVYVELGAGLILWTLLISGLWMYFKMLGAREKAGRKGLFWLSPGRLWRGLHRVVSVAAAVFLLAIAFSGTWIGFESVYHNAAPQIRMALTGKRSANPLGFDETPRPLTDDEVGQMTAATVEDFAKASPGTPIKVLRVRYYGRMKQGAVITGGSETTQVIFNTETGERATLNSPLYPDGGFPFGTQVHENIKHFHSGAMFGISARLMNLTAGLSLIFLSVSGIVVYLDLWLKRRKAGRGGFVWL